MWCDADGDSEIDRNWINSCNMDAVCCIYGMDLYVFYAVFLTERYICSEYAPRICQWLSINQIIIQT